MIKFENVTATYTNDIGVFNLTFHIPKGELVFLMGPTGAGKSTVLRTIYKDVSITDGELYINGEDIKKLPKRQIPRFRRKIGMIFQDYRLIQDRTVYENIALPLQISGQKKKEIRHKVHEIINKVGLENRQKNYPGQLSGGEKQRVSIARALVKDPIVILADEPTGNLDKQNSKNVVQIIKDLVNHYNISFIIATHNLSIIKKFDKIVKLSEGKII